MAISLAAHQNYHHTPLTCNILVTEHQHRYVLAFDVFSHIARPGFHVHHTSTKSQNLFLASSETCRAGSMMEHLLDRITVHRTWSRICISAFWGLCLASWNLYDSFYPCFSGIGSSAYISSNLRDWRVQDRFECTSVGLICSDMFSPSSSSGNTVKANQLRKLWCNDFL